MHNSHAAPSQSEDNPGPELWNLNMALVFLNNWRKNSFHFLTQYLIFVVPSSSLWYQEVDIGVTFHTPFLPPLSLIMMILVWSDFDHDDFEHDDLGQGPLDYPSMQGLDLGADFDCKPLIPPPAHQVGGHNDNDNENDDGNNDDDDNDYNDHDDQIW